MSIIRVQSIFSSIESPDTERTVGVTLSLDPAERALALLVDNFDQQVADVGQTHEPRKLSDNLFSLAPSFPPSYWRALCSKPRTRPHVALSCVVPRLPGARWSKD